MQDLDDLFKDRLEEEAPFPNRAKQWNQLSQRLDAFDAGSIQAPKGTGSALTWWKVATLISLATAGYFAWNCFQNRAENKELRTEIAQLKQTQVTPPQPVPAEQGATPQATMPTNAEQARQENEPMATSKQSEVNRTSKSVGKSQYGAPTQKRVPQKSKGDKTNKTAIDGQKTEEPIANAPVSVQSEIANQPSQEPVIDHKSAEQVPSIDCVQVTLALARVDSLQKELSKLQDSLAAKDDKPLASAEIKPEVKPAQKHFRVGTHATIGFVQPRQKGISSIRGQGVSLEAKVWKSLWVSATVDWLNHEVSTSEFIPKFHAHHDTIPKPPGGWGGGGGGGSFNHKLVLVESAVRQQHLGIGLRYNLPVRFWVQPAVRLAHEWVHISPSLVTYKFIEDDPGGPGPNPHPEEDRYTAEKLPDKWLANKWRMGLGLEKELPNWTFGLWADYSKDLSASTPSFDALYVRASAQYRF